MTEKRFNCHVKFSAMPNGIMVLDYERHGDEQTVIEDISREKAHRVMDRLNELNNENEQLKEENKTLKHHIKKLEKELHLAHMRSMFSTVKSFNGDVSKRYYYSEETDRVYDTANTYGQYNKILDKKEIAMLLNEYETMLNGDLNE